MQFPKTLSLFIAASLASPSASEQATNGLRGSVSSQTDTREQYKPVYDENSLIMPYEVDCFWNEPLQYGGKQHVDEGWAGGAIGPNEGDVDAAYWPSAFKMKKGEKLILRGQYGHVRYESISSYGGEPYRALGSIMGWELEPDEGSSNPFREGRRDTPMEERWFTITIANELKPSNPANNTLYVLTEDSEEDENRVEIRWRVYLADRKYDLAYDARGGGQLPLPVALINPDGTEGTFECDEGNPLSRLAASSYGNAAFGVQNMTKAWQSYPCTAEKLAKGEFCNNPWTAPARNPPLFEKNWNDMYSLAGLFMPPEEREQYNPGNVGCGGQQGPPDIPGNLYGQYGTMWVSNVYGDVIQIIGRAPKTPKTYFDDPTYDTSSADMLYWSMSNSDLTTFQTASGVSDQMVPVDEEGYFSIIVSKPEHRPPSATQACGHAWTTLSRRGDGTGRNGIQMLVFRQTWPMNGFNQTLFNVCEPGQEESAMGEYMPRGQYYSGVEEFEKTVGCLTSARI